MEIAKIRNENASCLFSWCASSSKKLKDSLFSYFFLLFFSKPFFCHYSPFCAFCNRMNIHVVAKWTFDAAPWLFYITLFVPHFSILQYWPKSNSFSILVQNVRYLNIFEILMYQTLPSIHLCSVLACIEKIAFKTFYYARKRQWSLIRCYLDSIALFYCIQIHTLPTYPLVFHNLHHFFPAKNEDTQMIP